MKKEAMLKRIQKHLPDDIVIEDETKSELTIDEFIGTLSWIAYFCRHYNKYGKSKLPEMVWPIISSNVMLVLDLYIEPDDNGKHVIYLKKPSEDLLNKFINQ